MPPRPVILVIVVLWLTMTSLLVYHELWPALFPAEPPPFTIDLTEEGGAGKIAVPWKVLKNGAWVYNATTKVKPGEAEDTYELHCELRPRPIDFARHLGLIGAQLASAPVGPLHVVGPLGMRPVERADPPRPLDPGLRLLLGTNLHFPLNDMKSCYHVTSDGRLREVRVETEYRIVEEGKSPLVVRMRISGRPRDGRFLPRYEVGSPGAGVELRDANEGVEAVPVSARGFVLNPLHPVNQVPGLRSGRRWQTPLIDPLSFGSLSAAVSGGSAPADLVKLQALQPGDIRLPVLTARVTRGSCSQAWNHVEIPCWVIEYSDPDVVTLSLTLWAREPDGLVLRQEADLWGDHWEFRRERE